MSDQNNSSTSVTDPYDFERSAAEYYRQQAAFLDTVNKTYGATVAAQILLTVVPGPAGQSSALPWISAKAQHLASAIVDKANQFNDIQGLDSSIDSLGYDPQVVRQAAQHYLDNAKTLEAKFEQLPASFDRESYIKLIEIQQMQSHADSINTRVQQDQQHDDGQHSQAWTAPGLGDDIAAQTQTQAQFGAEDYDEGSRKTAQAATDISKQAVKIGLEIEGEPTPDDQSEIADKIRSGEPLTTEEQATLDQAYDSIKTNYQDVLKIDAELPPVEAVDPQSQLEQELSVPTGGIQVAAAGDLQPGMLEGVAFGSQSNTPTTTAQPALSQAQLHSLAQDQALGAHIGDALGYGVAQLTANDQGWNDTERWAANAFLKTLGQNLGESWGHNTEITLNAQGQYSDSGESVWSDFGQELQTQSWQSGINLMSQQLSDQVVGQLGLNSEWSLVAEGMLDYGFNAGFQTLASNAFNVNFSQSPNSVPVNFGSVGIGAATNLVSQQLFQNANAEWQTIGNSGMNQLGQGFSSALAGNGFQFSGPNFLSAVAGSLVMNEMGIGTTETGQTLAQVGAMVGMAFGPIGSFVGQIIGGAIGDAVSCEVPEPPPPPAPAGIVSLRYDGEHYVIDELHVNATGPQGMLRQLGQQTCDQLNQLHQASGAQLANAAQDLHLSIQLDQHGLHLQQGDSRQHFSHNQSAQLLDQAITGQVHDWQLEGGDLYSKRALLNSQASTVSELWQDLSDAEIYANYQHHQAEIDALLNDPNIQQQLAALQAAGERDGEDTLRQAQGERVWEVRAESNDSVRAESNGSVRAESNDSVRAEPVEALSNGGSELDPSTGEAQTRVADLKQETFSPELLQLAELQAVIERVESQGLNLEHAQEQVSRLSNLLSAEGLDLNDYSLADLSLSLQGEDLLLSVSNAQGVQAVLVKDWQNNHKLTTQQNQHSAMKQKLWYSAAPVDVRQAA